MCIIFELCLQGIDMGHCGSKLASRDFVPGPRTSAPPPLSSPKKTTTEAIKIRVNPMIADESKTPSKEHDSPLGLPNVVSRPIEGRSIILDDVRDEKARLIEQLQKTIKQQRALMHEGRNVRSAALGHVQASMDAMKTSMDELRALLSAKPPEAIAEKLTRSLVEMERAYHLQHLTQVSEQYTAIIENYLLSPDDKEEFALVAWVNSMIDMLSSEALIPIRKAGLLTSSTEYIVHGHKAILLYSLVNLMQNAIKFTRPKLSASSVMPLDITVSLKEEEGAFWFSVVDKGIGMDKEQAARCLDASHKRYTLIQGSGSGLSAVHSALIKVGGDIAVASAKDLGTSFKLTLPLALISKTSQLVDYSKLCVLIADDGAINVKLSIRLLRSLGVPLKNIFSAGSKDEAFTVFTKQHGLGRPINIIFTDLNMGRGMDGFDLAHEVRVFEAAVSPSLHTPIIIVSGTICTSDKGFEFADAQLLKPISRDDLAIHLSKAAHSPSTSVKRIIEETATSSAGSVR